VPMLIDGICHLRQPGPILEKFQNVRRAEKLDAVLRGVAKRLEQSGRDQGRNIVRLAIEQPSTSRRIRRDGLEPPSPVTAERERATKT
jgi:hypothetical protein